VLLMVFDREIRDKIAVFKCMESVEKDNCEGAIRELAEFLDSDDSLDCKGLVVDLGGGYKVGEKFLHEIMPIVNLLRAQQKRIFIINASEKVESFIAFRGMDTAIKVLPDFTSVVNFIDPAASLKVPKRIDVEFINAFIEATIKTLTIQCGLKNVTPGKPAVVEKNIDGFVSGVVAIIGLRSAKFKGAIAVCFPEPVFLSIMSKMLAEEFKELTKELEDGAGEIVNIIFGQAKAVLSEKGYSIERAIPTVVSGKDVARMRFTPSPSILVPFETEVGKFWIEIGRGR